MSNARPGRHVLEREMVVRAERAEVFAFFADAYNLERITPPELRFRIVEHEGDMGTGARIAYRLRLFGVPFGWRTLISRWEPETAFVDEMTSGPYRRWVHLHTFEPAPGGTLVRDRVEYELPFGPLGRLALPLVRRQLRRIFDYRADAIRRLVEAA